MFALLALTALARCWNAGDVFVAGQIYFVDPDCYSRMTRVAAIVESPGTIIHEHAFENWPDGVVPHTTAPMDYTVAAVAWLLKPWMPEGGLSAVTAVDLAGAITPVLLGLATAFFLWFWAGRLRLRYRVPMLLLFALSPILVHGTSLGRPDHQALLILTLAVALGAEVALLSFSKGKGAGEDEAGRLRVARSIKRWGIAAGAAWGMSLWVSLYEPGILFIATALFALAWHRKALFARERWAGHGTLLGVLVVAGLVDGWHWPLPSDPDVVKFFPNWSQTIAELASVAPWSPVLRMWTLALLPVVPLLLAWSAFRGERRSLWWLWMGGLLLVLTCWQIRWGYFYALAFAMALPWFLPMLELTRRRWIALALFGMALWPLARDWETRLALNPAGEVELRSRLERRRENVELRGIATAVRDAHKGEERQFGVLAPWWFSPALAYWSGQSCVAGSSHQSLPGTVDGSRFYRSIFWPEAAEILSRRKVTYVLAYAPERVLDISEKIIGTPVATPEVTMASLLYTQPHSAPDALELLGANSSFKIFRVLPAPGQAPQ